MAVFAPSVMVLAFLSTNPRLYLYKFYLSAILSITLPDLLLATLFLKRVSRYRNRRYCDILIFLVCGFSMHNRILNEFFKYSYIVRGDLEGATGAD